MRRKFVLKGIEGDYGGLERIGGDCYEIWGYDFMIMIFMIFIGFVDRKELMI